MVCLGGGVCDREDDMTDIDRLKYWLERSRQNIGIIRSRSCCTAGLEARQAELEGYLSAKLQSMGLNLGILPIVYVGIAAGVTLSALGTWIWTHYKDTEIEKQRLQCTQYAMENKLDPNQYCPAQQRTTTDEILGFLKILVVCGAGFMLFQMFSKK